MKRYFNFLTLLLFCGGGSMLASCSDDDKGSIYGSTHPIESVTAVDGSKTISAEISDTDKTIKFGTFEELMDLGNVEVTFTLAQGVVMKTPTKRTATVDLTVPCKIEVNNGVTDIAYTMTAKTKEIPEPVISAQVAGDNAVIEGRTISVAYKTGMDINAVVVDLTLQNGATVKSPADKTFDLESGDGTLVIEYLNNQYTYTVKLTGYVDPILSKGWSDVTSEFGPLPTYIKVYKTEKAAGRDGNVAYVAIMGKQATMGVVGDGTKAPKPITDLEAGGAYKVYLVGVNSTYTQTIIRDGKFVQESSARSFGTIGQDKDGSYKMVYAQKFNDKLYSFPFRTGEGAYVARDPKDGKVWEPQTAVSGAPMILWDGKVLTDKQIICNEELALWYDGLKYARAAVGISKNGKIFAFCGEQVGDGKGTTMPETAQIMKDLGCVSAFTFEGSSSPNLHINQKKTVTNSKESNLKAVQCALAFK